MKRDRAETVLAVVIPFLLASSALAALVLWHRANLLPSGHDARQHYTQTMRIAETAANRPADLPRLLQEQAARYMPLPYFTAAALMTATDFSYWGMILNIIGYAAVALASLIILGRIAAPERAASILPVAAVLATPAFWEAGASFNLEMPLLAGASAILVLLIAAPAIRSSLVPAAAFIAALLTQTKFVVLIPVLPAGIVLCLEGDAHLRRRRFIILAAVILSATLWLIPHIGVAPDELAFDFDNPSVEDFPGPFFYAVQWTVGYRSALLLALLAILLVYRVRNGGLERRDLAFALFAFIPFAFFTALDTRRAWYVLAPYIALPVWSAFRAESLRERTRVRRLVAGTTVAYVLLAAVNIAVVARSAFQAGPGRISGIRLPTPPRNVARSEAIMQIRNGQEGIVRGKPEQAAGLFGIFLDANANDADARRALAAILARIGFKDDARSHWERLFTAEAPFGQKLDALNDLAEMEAEGRADPGTFERCYAPLKAQYAGDPEITTSLLSARIHALQRRKDWDAALSAVAELRTVLSPKRVPGVNLEEALILNEAGRPDEAERRLRANLDLAERDGAVYADTALHLALMRAAAKDFTEARSFLAKAAAADHDDGSLARAVIEIAGQMGGPGDDARRLRGEYADQLRGEAAALVLIEIGKDALELGDRKRSRTVFRRALDKAESDTSKTWLADSLTSLDDEERARHEAPP